jgi:hypothetical protein
MRNSRAVTGFDPTTAEIDLGKRVFADTDVGFSVLEITVECVYVRAYIPSIKRYEASVRLCVWHHTAKSAVVDHAGALHEMMHRIAIARHLLACSQADPFLNP